MKTLNFLPFEGDQEGKDVGRAQNLIHQRLCKSTRRPSFSRACTQESTGKADFILVPFIHSVIYSFTSP